MKLAKLFALWSMALLVALSGCSLFTPEKDEASRKPAAKPAAKPAPKKAAPKKAVKPAPKKAAVKKAVKPAPKKAAPKKPYDFKLSLDKGNGIYKKGEKVTIRFQFLKDGKPAAGQKIAIWIRGAQKNQYLTSSAQGNTFTLLAEKPWTMVYFSAVDGKNKPIRYAVAKNSTRAATSTIGFMTEPEKIQVAAPEPADFEAFWANVKKELAKVPVKVLEKKPRDLGKRFRGKINTYDVKIACAGNAPVSGYLSIPAKAKAKSLPVIVSYHGAGVYSASPSPNFRAITFDVNAHGIANGKPRAFYQNLNRTTLKGYYRLNANDRNKFYFRNMYLRVQRALDYVKTLPEWNGKDLIVSGGSQGGAQALVAGGMDKDVTLIYAAVPALCDHSGILAGKGRESGWPRLIRKNKKGKVTDPAVAKTAPYFDAAYFAKRIKGEAFLTVGLLDTTCVPTSVYAAYNSIPGKKKHMTSFPTKAHGGTYSTAFQKRRNEILAAAAKAAKAKKK